MDHDPHQDRIRALFSDLRQQDQQRVASFARVWQAALDQQAHRRPARKHLARSFATTVGSALRTVLYRMRATAGSADPTPAAHRYLASRLIAAAIVVVVVLALVTLPWSRTHPHKGSSLARAVPSSQPTFLEVGPSSISDPIWHWRSPTAFLLADPADAPWPTDADDEAPDDFHSVRRNPQSL